MIADSGLARRGPLAGPPRVSDPAADSVAPDAARLSACAEWDSLSEGLQLMLAAAALRRMITVVASQAETLASEMEAGALPDAGGPDALRLLAAVVRATADTPDSDGLT
jgi:hypothetical protein